MYQLNLKFKSNRKQQKKMFNFMFNFIEYIARYISTLKHINIISYPPPRPPPHYSQDNSHPST